MNLLTSIQKLFFVITILFGLTFNCFSQNSAQLRVEIEKLIRFDTDIDFRKTPGFIIGVIDGDSTYITSFGKKDKSFNGEISAEDIFEIGSITKLYITQLCLELEKLHLLRTSDHINQWINPKYTNPRLEQLTVQHLLHHTSGLPKRPTWFGKKEKNNQNPYEYYKTEDLLTFYRDYIPEKKPKAFVYSHTNFALLEHIIEKATNMSIEDALQLYLNKPIKLENTFFDLTENKTDAISKGYDRSGKLVLPWTYASFKGSEGIKTSLQDALTFMRHTLKQQVNYNDVGQTTFNSSLRMWNGWHMLEIDKYPILTQTGQTSGHNAFISISPSTKTGVVIFANSSIGTEDLGFQILKMINYNWRRQVSNL